MAADDRRRQAGGIGATSAAPRTDRWDRSADEAVRVAKALRLAAEAEGLRVTTADRPPHANRFVVIDSWSNEQVVVEVFADGGRLRPAVQLDVGPVLHPDDIAADKMLALWGRGEPRDFLDVVALHARYSEARLLELAGLKDRGFSAESFALALDAVERITETRWVAAGVPRELASSVRDTVRRWRRELP